MLAIAAGATALFVLLFIDKPPFAGPGRFFLLYYHAPIGFVFMVYVFDRLERRWAIAWRQWLLEVLVVGLALSRTLAPLPFFSGHALFLSYSIAAPGSRLASWLAALVFVDVVAIKVFLLHDATVIGGTVIGLIAATIVRRVAVQPPQVKA